MAQVFPLNAPASGRDPTLSLLLDTLAWLPDPWTLLAERVIGETEAVGAVLVHPEIGVALVDVAPGDAGPAAAALGALLARERFAEFFPGELPIVTASVAAEEIPAIGERLAEAFEAAPPLSIDDRDWGDAVIELLLQPSDMAMAPAGGQAEAMHGVTAPFLPPPEPVPPMAPPEAPSFADRPALSAAEVEGDAPPLHADWRMAVGYQPPRRHGALVAAAIAVLLLGGVAGLGLAVENGALPLPASVASQSHPVEAPLAPAEAGDRIGSAAGPALSDRPPPVPAAPPVMLAAKPLASPPPAAPKPTRVAALPPPPRQIAEEKPPAPPPAHAAPVAAPPPKPAPAPPQIVDNKPTVPAAPPPRTVESKPAPPPAPPAKVAAKPRPPAAKPQVAAASHPPPRTPRASARVEVPPLRPPIDATDLPPLDEPAPKPTMAFSPPMPPQPSPAPPAPQPVAAAPTPLVPAIGPPRRLTRAPSPIEQEAAGGRRECRPYTANSTLAGNGIACRDGDGQWRLVSEVPLR